VSVKAENGASPFPGAPLIVSAESSGDPVALAETAMKASASSAPRNPTSCGLQWFMELLLLSMQVT